MKHALAIFAKTPVPGLVKTRLTPPLSPEEGADLYRCMLLDTIARVRTLRIDTFIFFDGEETFFQRIAPGMPLIPQSGAGLGERLEHAFSMLASLGYRSRAVIGSDAPDLPLAYIRESFDLLESGRDAVFGPAEDGGYYLVALNCGNGSLFRDIPWSTSRVLEKSLQQGKETGIATALVPTWYDVDGIDDLYRPGLTDPLNGAPLTRRFIAELGMTTLPAAGAL